MSKRECGRTSNLSPFIREHINKLMLFDLVDGSLSLSRTSLESYHNDDFSVFGIVKEIIETDDVGPAVVIDDALLVKKVQKTPGEDIPIEPIEHCGRVAIQISQIDLAWSNDE